MSPFAALADNEYTYCIETACGKLFRKPSGKGAPPKRCPACRKAHAFKVRAPKPTVTFCATCGEKLPVKKGPGRGKKYCSDECRFSSWTSQRHPKPSKLLCGNEGCGKAFDIEPGPGAPPRYCPDCRPTH